MLHPSTQATVYFVWAFVIHLVVDWLAQNDWMARNKANVRHPAAYVHGGMHALALLLVFPWYVALYVGVVHLLIDQRGALATWRRWFRQTRHGEVALHVALWGDQVTHILVLAVASLALAGR